MNATLVARAQEGDQAAFAEIAHAIGGRLFAMAYRVLRDHDRAEDATQQAIVAIWRSLPDLRDSSRFDAWSMKVLINACNREVRGANARRLVDLTAIPTDPIADQAELSVEDRDQLDRGFRRLSVELRAVLVLQHYLGLDTGEIAALLDIPSGTVKSRAHAARGAMRAALEADARPTRSQERTA